MHHPARRRQGDNGVPANGNETTAHSMEENPMTTETRAEVCSCSARQAKIGRTLELVCSGCGERIDTRPEDLHVGDLVTGIFRGEKPLTYVDLQSVMVQITPSYEQAYLRTHVRKVGPAPTLSDADRLRIANGRALGFIQPDDPQEADRG